MAVPGLSRPRWRSAVSWHSAGSRSASAARVPGERSSEVRPVSAARPAAVAAQHTLNPQFARQRACRPEAAAQAAGCVQGRRRTAAHPSRPTFGTAAPDVAGAAAAPKSPARQRPCASGWRFPRCAGRLGQLGAAMPLAGDATEACAASAGPGRQHRWLPARQPGAPQRLEAGLG